MIKDIKGRGTKTYKLNLGEILTINVIAKIAFEIKLNVYIIAGPKYILTLLTSSLKMGQRHTAHARMSRCW